MTCLKLGHIPLIARQDFWLNRFFSGGGEIVCTVSVLELNQEPIHWDELMFVREASSRNIWSVLYPHLESYWEDVAS